MSHWTIARGINLDIDWDYTMAWIPASLFKTRVRLMICPKAKRVQLVSYVTIAEMNMVWQL